MADVQPTWQPNWDNVHFDHEAANAATDDLVKGWLLEQSAAMLHPVDPPAASRFSRPPMRHRVLHQGLAN